MNDNHQICSDPVCRIVDTKTGKIVTVYRDIDGSVIGWNRRKTTEETL